MILPNDILIRATPDGQTVWVSQRMVCEACELTDEYMWVTQTRYKSSLPPSWRKVADQTEFFLGDKPGKAWRWGRKGGQYYYDYDHIPNRKPTCYRDLLPSKEELIAAVEDQKLDAYLCVCELISILENLAIITQAKAFVSLIKLIRGKNDENVIYDLINEKNADYSARSPFGRVQSKPQTAIFADGGDRYGDRDRTGPGYGGGPRTRPVDAPGASRMRQRGSGADAPTDGVPGGEPLEASRHRGPR